MKKITVRILTAMFGVMMVLTVVVAVPKTAYAAGQISLNEIDKKMDDYIAWLNSTNATYWNANVSEARLKEALDKSTPDFSVGMTSAYCKGTKKSGVEHSRNSFVGNQPACTSNTFGGGRQCRGFARYFWYYLFDETVTSVNAKGNWTAYNGVPSGGLQAGDYVDCKGHAYIVRSVDQNGEIKAVHANGLASTKPCGVLYGGVYYTDSVYATESDLANDSSCVVLRYNHIVNNTADTQKPSQPVVSACNHKYDDYGYCKNCKGEYSISLKNMNAPYYAVKADVPVRKRPYAPVTIDDRLAKGETVTVVAQGTNSQNNVWFKLEDGSWVFSGNLAASPVSFSGVTVKNNAYGNATPYITVKYDSGKRPSNVGIYVGTTENNMRVVASDKINHKKNPFNAWYDLNSEAKLKLKKGTTYYYQFYAVIGGVEYKTAPMHFKAK